MARTLPASPHILISALVLAFSLPARAQLSINQNLTPNNMVQNILMGQDVEISNVSFNGVSGSIIPSLYPTIGQMGRFTGANTVLGFNGVFLCTGNAQTILAGPNNVLMATSTGQAGGGFEITPDLDLSHLTGWPDWIYGGNNIGNKSVLEFDFVPFNDMVSFNYVFSSEEYERWACSHYNDAFGLFISGPGIPTNINGPFTNNAMNIAFIPGSLAPVTINSVNSGRMNANNANGLWLDPFQPCFAANPNWQADSIYYRYNGGQWNIPQPLSNAPQLEAPYNTDPYYIQHNGLTVKLTASAAVQIGETYHIKMGIANTDDNLYSSAAWIEGGTFAALDRFTLTVDASYNVDLSDTIPVLYQSSTDSVFLRFNRRGGFYLDEYLQLAVGGDAVAGVDYLPIFPDSLHFSQLDSAVVLPIALPVHATETRDLIINLITSEGNKVATYHFILAGENTTGVKPLANPTEALVVFPNPADQALHVSLPSGMKGPAEVQVLDMTGRVVLRQGLNAASGTLDLGQFPNGLYTVKVEVDGHVATARVSVKH